MRVAKTRPTSGRLVVLLPALVAGVVLSAATAFGQSTPVVNAVSPGVVLTPGTPNAVIPITITRTSTTPISGVSVTFQLSTLDLVGTALGGFLAATGGNPSGPYVTNNGGGSYTVDGVTLGSPCGSSAQSGVVFNVTVGSSATSGSGTLTITQVKLRDCSNVPIPSTIGSVATVEIDRTGPTITQCAPNQAGGAGAACQAAVPDFTASVVATDPHGPVTVTQIPTAGSLVGLGPTSVTLTASDAFGNSSTCVATFTVSDQTPPQIAGVAANMTVFTGPGAVACSATATWTPPTATDNCPGVTLTSDHAPGSTFPVGSTLVTYTATDAASHTTTASFTVTVVDNTAPVVTLASPNGGETFIIGTMQTVTWSGADNCALATFDLELSTDGGGSYAPVVSGQPYSSSYVWTVPGSSTSQARLRVTLHDGGGNSASDASDADFTIRPSNFPPSLAHIGNKVTDELVLLTFTAVATDPDAGQTLAYTLDAGAPAGASIDLGSGVFSWTPTEAQGPGVYSVTVRVTDNGAPSLNAFETLTITVNEVDLAPITLSATALMTGNDDDGTTKIQLSWSPQPAGMSVVLYRHGFGSYPEYDDEAGVEPPAPTAYPPDAGWTTVATVSGSSTVDEVAWPGRDYYYYVGYVLGPGANVSGPSNQTSGALNYKLGDVMNPGLVPAQFGHGDNVVNTSDISLLGAHYGLTGNAVAPFNYLDIGPTTTGYVDGRPQTDDAIDFEDLILYSINYEVPALLSRSAGARSTAKPLAGAQQAFDRVWVEAPTSVQAGQTFTVHVKMMGTGIVQGVSTRLFWNALIAHPTGVVTGDWLQGQPGVMYSPDPGTIDAVMLGVWPFGFMGEGDLAELTFVASATGDPHVLVSSAKARDALNRPIALSPLAVTPRLGTSTMLSAPAPNPFRTTAEFAVNLPESGPMELAIYSVDGRRVRTLASGQRTAGEYRLIWDGRNDSGEGSRAGVYFARLETRNGQWMRTVALLR